MFAIGVITWQFLQILRLSESIQFISSQNVNRELIISTENGYVQGTQKVTYTDKKYWAYEGIPYAKPPLENLRFRAPEQASSWTGILDATKERPTCVETMNTLYNDIIVMGYEDCLYINIYTPTNPHYLKKYLPVLVWIYGGAFQFGNSSSSFYGADNLLDQGVIVITFNYRIGPLGFLSTEDLESPGNYGLKDQILAFKWVQKNIKNFGGDKKRVTIAGQSAGSASVLYHVLSPKSKGLFQSVIAISGSPLCSWAYKYDSSKVAFDFGLAAGIRTRNTTELISRLRYTNIDIIKQASRLMLLSYVPQIDRSGFPFAPSVEPHHNEAFITESPFESFQTGKFNRVSILMGITTLETLFFVGTLDLLKPLNFIYDLSPGSLPHRGMNIQTPIERRAAGLNIIKFYFSSESYIGASEKEYLQYTSDDRFTRPLHKTAQLVSRYTPIYYYLFSYMGDHGKKVLKGLLERRPVRGVAHVEDLFYVWRRQGTPDPTGFDKVMSARLIRLWTNFIKTRNPTPVKEKLLQGIIWPAVKSPRDVTYIKIDANFSIHHNYREAQMEFWENIYKKYSHPPYYTY